MSRRKLIRTVLFAGVALVAGTGLIAPLLNAGHFRGQIQHALESALNRRVSIGKVYFNVFTGPGFTVEDVLIQEAPGMGIEPFAHVVSLRARVRLASLWSGNLSFSNLKLDEPAVNFVKSAAGPWNVQALADRTAAAGPGALASVPDIEIRNGRLNFKFGNTKSVFYVNNADLDLYPNDWGDLVIRFSGEPARTDHLAQGLGLLVARGALRSNPAALNMSVQLERTAIPELARLFDAQDTGVRGMVASNLKLDGPLSKINISGDLRIEDIHRWDLMPNKGEGWTLNYAGFWNAIEQRIEIETRPADRQGTPVNGKFTASDYLSSPKWQASLSFHDLPAADFLDTARHMGAPFPAGATLDAKLNGELSYARPEGVKGALSLNDAAFKFPQGGVTEFAAAPLAIAGNQVRFGPAEIRLDDDQTVQIEAEYALDSRALKLSLTTKALSVAQTKAVVARLLGTGSVPFLERCRLGSWKGSLTFDRRDETPGEWTGDFDLTGTQIDVPGLASPVRLASAQVQLQPGAVALTRMRGHAGPIAFEGDYRTLQGTDKPDRMRLTFGELQLEELERLLLPSLSRQQGFIARALRLDPAPVPEWLKSRDVESSLQAKEVKVGEASLGSLRGRLTWTGTSVQITGLETKLGETESAGKLSVNLKAGNPVYRWVGQAQGIDYRNGSLDLDGALESRGIGAALLENVRGEGAFSGNAITLAPDAQVDEIAGDYRLEPGPGAPHLTLSKVQVTQGQDVLHGQGATQADGRLVLELTAGRRQVRLTGMLLPVHPLPVP